MRFAHTWVRQRTGQSGASAPFPEWVDWFTTLMMCTLIVFMIAPEDFDYASLGSPMPEEGNAMSRLIWIALLAGSALVVLRYVRLARGVLSQMNPFFLAFVGLACLSVLWSIEPEFTIRRLIRVAAICLVSLAFVLVPGRRIQDVLRPMITVMLLGSMVLVALSPTLGVERSTSPELAGAWHGLATQKNGLGSLAAIGTLLWLHAWLAREGRWPMILLGLAVSLLCLFNSRSSTSLLATAFAAPFMMVLIRSPRGLRRHMPWLVVLFATGLLLYSLAVLQLVPGLEFLLRPLEALTGKDPSFSGRTNIWGIVSESIGRHPILGGGYGAYWIGPVMGTAAYEHVTRLYFYPTEAHSGYLDIINDLGVLGGACLIGYLLVYLRQSLRVLARTRAQGALYLGLLFQQLIANMSESRWLNVLCIEFVIMTLATAALARTQLNHRLEEYYRRYERRSGLVRSGSPAG